MSGGLIPPRARPENCAKRGEATLRMTVEDTGIGIPEDRRTDIFGKFTHLMNQRVVSMMLENLGGRVDVAPTGRDAVEMLGRFPYDLVFMDCWMPEIDGIAATKLIRRQEPADRHVPIIATTAIAQEQDRERCLAAGMDDYLSKPVAAEDLRAALDRWMPAAGRPATVAGPG